jgi:hypothetical protein
MNRRGHRTSLQEQLEIPQHAAAGATDATIADALGCSTVSDYGCEGLRLVLGRNSSPNPSAPCRICQTGYGGAMESQRYNRYQLLDLSRHVKVGQEDRATFHASRTATESRPPPFSAHAPGFRSTRSD